MAFENAHFVLYAHSAKQICSDRLAIIFSEEVSRYLNVECNSVIFDPKPITMHLSTHHTLLSSLHQNLHSLYSNVTGAKRTCRLNWLDKLSYKFPLHNSQQKCSTKSPYCTYKYHHLYVNFLTFWD